MLAARSPLHLRAPALVDCLPNFIDQWARKPRVAALSSKNRRHPSTLGGQQKLSPSHGSHGEMPVTKTEAPPKLTAGPTIARPFSGSPLTACTRMIGTHSSIANRKRRILKCGGALNMCCGNEPISRAAHALKQPTKPPSLRTRVGAILALCLIFELTSWPFPTIATFKVPRKLFPHHFLIGIYRCPVNRGMLPIFICFCFRFFLYIGLISEMVPLPRGNTVTCEQFPRLEDDVCTPIESLLNNRFRQCGKPSGFASNKELCYRKHRFCKKGRCHRRAEFA